MTLGGPWMEGSFQMTLNKDLKKGEKKSKGFLLFAHSIVCTRHTQNKWGTWGGGGDLFMERYVNLLSENSCVWIWY